MNQPPPKREMRIPLPVLFVHHRDDGCPASSYADALDLRARVTRSLRVDFVTVVGGDPPTSAPCDAQSAHGYLGKEADVVQVIADWLRGATVPSQVGA